jgi:hypothetical protein
MPIHVISHRETPNDDELQLMILIALQGLSKLVMTPSFFIANAPKRKEIKNSKGQVSSCKNQIMSGLG